MPKAQVQIIGSKELLKKVRPLLFDIAQDARKLAETSLNKPITCAKECAWCCYQKVIVNVFEGAMIYAYLVETKRWSSAVEAKLRWADKAMTEATHAAWLAQRMPCPFLHETEPGRGECTVYPVRPISCAVTFSNRGDPSSCAEVNGDAQLQVSMMDANMVQLMEIKGAMENGLVDGGQLWALTLPGAVLYAHALLQHLPLPDVHKVSLMELHTQGPDDPEDHAEFVSETFDAIAKIRMPNE
jgi:Fe-S-cluster containining protein